MKKLLYGAIAAAGLAAFSAQAVPFFDVWGHGIGYWESQDDARSTADTICRQNGYQGAYVEVVQTYESGGGHITYGLAQCY